MALIKRFVKAILFYGYDIYIVFVILLQIVMIIFSVSFS